VPSGQWDDGGNVLVLGDRVVVCDERHVETGSRLAAAGFDVLTAPGGELGAVRGGPRSMCAAIERDPAVPTGTPPQLQGQPPLAVRPGQDGQREQELAASGWG